METEEKDYLYYFWNPDHEDWLREFAPLEKDKALKGVTPFGITDSKKMVNLADFNLEELMCVVDTIRCYYGSSSGRYHKFNEDYSSYGLKHMVERVLQKITKGRINYVSNGTLILAMHLAGYKFQRIPGTPNCLFNSPKKSIKKMTDQLPEYIWRVMESGFTEERLDSLFSGVRSYRSSTNFRAMIKFCQRMKVLAPYNSMLAYIQRPWAKYLLNEGKWKKLFSRGIKPDARPILVLIPFGPLEYLFDVADTYALPDSKFDDEEIEKVIEELSDPFEANGDVNSAQYQLLLKNLSPYGIAYNLSMVAGRNFCAKIMRLDKKEETIDINIGNHNLKYPANFLLSVNSQASDAERFASIIHELGHFFCHHIGGPCTPKEWWQYRPLDHGAKEFEAESISWLICNRLWISSPSEKYLNGYLDKNDEIPSGISIDMIFKASNDIWRMLMDPVPLAKGYLHKFDKTFVSAIKAMREKPVQQSLFPNL